MIHIDIWISPQAITPGGCDSKISKVLELDPDPYPKNATNHQDAMEVVMNSAYFS